MKVLIRLIGSLVFAVVLVLAFAFLRFSRNASAQFAHPNFSIHDEVAHADPELGRRIFTIRNGCVDCHGVDLAGAKIMEDPVMGSVWGANLTPYKLKDWSDEEIAAAIRYGIHKSGRSLRFMPSFDFAKLAKSDVAALIAYIRSVPPVQRDNHLNTFGPLARVLSSFGQMPVMFPAFQLDQSAGFATKPDEKPDAAFGKYLANACTGCHGGELRGGKIPGGDPSWPEAADIRLGANPKWTEASFHQFIESGISPITGKTPRPPMPIAALKSLNPTETAALWSYLSSLK